MTKRNLGPSGALFPLPAAIVAAGEGARIDACAVARIAPVASDPATLLVSLHRSHRTTGAIRRAGAYSANLPRAADAAVLDFFGTVSGNEREKFAASGWTLRPSSVPGAPTIAECPYALVCRVVRELEIGDWILFFGEIVEAWADESVLDPEGRVDLDRMDPLAYAAEIREYRRIGEKLGEVSRMGRALRDPGGDGAN